MLDSQKNLVNEIKCPSCDKSLTNKKFQNYDKFKICKCNNCKLTFTIPMKSGDLDFYKKYQIYNRPNAQEALISKKQFSKKFYRNILNTIPKKSRVLDFGCGYGAFVKVCIEHGMDAKGVDFNSSHIEIGKHLFNLGKELSVSNFQEDPSIFKENSYDLISIFEVIEHVENPRDLIQKINKLLKIDGILLISCPNEDRIKLGGRIFVDYPPHHLTRWNKESIKTILKKNGFSDPLIEIDSSLRDLVWTFIVNIKSKKINNNKNLENNIYQEKKNKFNLKFLFKKFTFLMTGILFYPFDLILKYLKIGTMGMKIYSKKINNL